MHITKSKRGTRDKYFEKSDLICTACYPPCITCGTTGDECLSCSEIYGLYTPDNTCVSDCSAENSNMFTDTATNLCTDCNVACKTCTGGSAV